MVAVFDIGFFVRCGFDNRSLVSGKESEVTNEMVGWENLEVFDELWVKKHCARE